MALLFFSSARGPAECTLAVSKAVTKFLDEARQLSVTTEIVENVLGDNPNTFRSVLISVEGLQSEQLIQRWLGTIQWICQSPYRPTHKRKNWFIGITCLKNPSQIIDSSIEFTTMKSSGAGGQHVNKTESAVRATHLATGISVKVQTERSQHANKRLAKLLLAHKLAEYEANTHQQHKTTRQQFHYSVPRGNSSLVFYGEKFSEKRH
ncbi:MULTISPECIES: peptide chain release factor H [Gilliamella]|uniref:peptide chain release factor H n=1 Tax=Gilliamella TaxID=1193503 RepID=UPI00080DAAA8|nr:MULTISPECIES: peptide chain release factor H [Gilliamella]MCO6537610.1 peptide chain release factor H [Gilliamella sp.]MCO6548229.1 peptide chain release factor H [Gilliamella sp.]MCO6553781.1 peptide chain release factor H [Gilliamella sp.]OCG35295.1 peptide chain release factor H [Gilliamella apicola]OCG50702.1 peptide chain release factor H [Gilliamella apicola]